MPLTGLRLALIGSGNMAEALVRGLLNAGAVKASQIVATDPRSERRELFVDRFGVEALGNNAEAAGRADVVIFAVKPQILERVGLEIAPSIQPQALVVSFAAGVSVSTIAATLGAHVRICRAMPNICAVVDRAATAIAPGPAATAEDVARVRAIFESVGMVEEVEESLMDAVTGLSGSGPAFVFMMIEALADAGVKVGLPRYQSQALAAHTVLGSARLLIETGEHPGVLKDQVTSPGGTAIAGLHTLEEGGLRTTLINAVVAASERSRELGKKD
jgi:pyrroline-5-carboxylate reductase